MVTVEAKTLELNDDLGDKLMKTFAAVPVLTLLTALSLNADAAQPTPQEVRAGAGKFTAGAIVGGLAGGPLGMVVGAIGGGLFAEQGFSNEASKRDLVKARTDLDQLGQEIAMQEAKIAELEEEALARLELKVFFETGVDQVTDLDRQRLKVMADYLKQNEALSINLDGYADPRGSDEYNNVLSMERAESVRSVLQDLGVDEARIKSTHHGSSGTVASGDLAAYTRDRRVEITLEPAKDVVTHSGW